MTFILNFHGIGAAQRAYEEGEEPYWIDESRFHACLDMVQGSPQNVLLTFDDGNASDYYFGFPELQKRGLGAIFFVLAGKIGQPGYLDADQIAEIDAHPLMQIGSHGMDHQKWAGIDEIRLKHEISESKKILEKICDRPITDAGLPFGVYNRHVILALRRAGYSHIYSSDGTERLTGGVPLPRYSVRNDSDMKHIGMMIDCTPTTLQKLKTEMRVQLKSMRP